MEELFDGNHQATEIAKALPPTSEKLFNALYCRRQLRFHPATQTLTDARDLDHNQTVRQALPLVVAGFAGKPARSQ